MEEIPASLREVTEIEKALNIANRTNLTLQELEKLDGQENLIQDRRGQIAFVEEKGRIKEAIALIILLLKKRFREVRENEVATQVKSLSLENLEALVKTVLRFNNLDGLSNWLTDRYTNSL
ncbi:MAG: DUF4351 domain-containing protein [Okeania sp. SIO2F4]|uniref:DUF4351 domain-containing protein n=1 Tax=Okeania sp. SIO2F4 TaxID=2607790 RepID=UPI00142CF9F0|nr:DUF4351 domain-containing protein [Okeania sp. SIO2F4]NES04184.1 DUF4351 domain-containing protein [Okeania sp. SIO2F4]